MSNNSFQISNFSPVEGKLVMMGEAQVTFSFSESIRALYSITQIHVDLWAEDDNGSSYHHSQETQTNSSTNEPSLLTFAGFPPAMNLLYRITVTGEEGSENTVYVSIDY